MFWSEKSRLIFDVNDTDIRFLKNALPKMDKAVIDEQAENLKRNALKPFPTFYSAESFVLLQTGKIWFSDKFYVLRNLYGVLNKPESGYDLFYIKKKDGSLRKLLTPHRELRYAQEFIKANILDLICEQNPDTYAYAYRKGVSVKDNAALHMGKEKIVKLDIKGFFESTSEGKVYAFYERYTPYDKAVLTMLTKLSCCNKALVQGAITSPQIANMILRDFDFEVGKFCAERGITYSRYSDDMTFSGDKAFPSDEVIKFVRDKLSQIGYRLNGSKTRIYGPNNRHKVTGIICNGKLHVEPEYKHELRKQVYYVRKFGVTDHLEQINGKKPTVYEAYEYIRRLYGQVSYALSINPDDEELRKYKEALELNLFVCEKKYETIKTSGSNRLGRFLKSLEDKPYTWFSLNSKNTGTKVVMKFVFENEEKGAVVGLRRYFEDNCNLKGTLDEIFGTWGSSQSYVRYVIDVPFDSEGSSEAFDEIKLVLNSFRQTVKYETVPCDKFDF